MESSILILIGILKNARGLGMTNIIMFIFLFHVLKIKDAGVAIRSVEMSAM